MGVLSFAEDKFRIISKILISNCLIQIQNIKYLTIMSISKSFKTCVIEKYADFRGRAPRSEYWWFWLSYILLSFVSTGLALVVADLNLSIWSKIFMCFYSLLIIFGLMCPFIAVSVRRLHDSGLSGWHFLWRFIPFIGFPITIYLMTRRSLNENLYNNRNSSKAIHSTTSMNKSMNKSRLKKIGITALILALGIFGFLSIYYIPYFIIVCAYYVYIIWTKRPLKGGDYLMLPLLRKIGLYKDISSDVIIKKKLIFFSMIMVLTLLFAFISVIITSDIDYYDEDSFNFIILNTIVIGLFVFSLIIWILFFFYEYMTQYIHRKSLD